MKFCKLLLSLALCAMCVSQASALEAGHNRGVSNHFGKIHTLEPGDAITLTTKLGTRTYEVTSVEKVSETDTNGCACKSTNLLQNGGIEYEETENPLPAPGRSDNGGTAGYAYPCGRSPDGRIPH